MTAEPSRPPRVVVGVDESLAGLRALRTAVDEARRRNAELHAIRVWPLNAAAHGAYQLIDEYRRAAVAALETAFVEAMGGVPFDLDVVPEIAAGASPGRILVRAASGDEDLLVVGATGGLPVLRLLHRSVPRYCVQKATCPVLVVPPTTFARQARHHSLAKDIERDLLQPT